MATEPAVASGPRAALARRSLAAAVAAGLVLLFGLTAAPSKAAVGQVGSCKIIASSNCPGADLRGADLSDTQFLYANFQGADMTGANLTGTSFTGTNLIGIKGERAKFIRTNFYFSSLEGANLDSADFTHAVVDSTLLPNVHAHKTNFAYASFPASDLSGAQLNGADLLKTKLAGIKLDGANLSHATAHYADFSGSTLRKADLSGAIVDYANFHKAHATGATMTNLHAHSANITHAFFQEVKGSGAQFWHANVDNTTFWGSDLTHAALRNMHAHNTSFGLVQMHHSQPTGSDFTGANFNHANVADTMWFQANLKDVSFENTHFSNTSLPSALNIGTADLFPSNLASDHVARHYFFMPVHASPLAYSSHGSCKISSGGETVSCQGKNNAHDATYPFQGDVGFSWGSTRSDGLRGFEIAGVDNKKLQGGASANLGAFHVHAAINMPEVSGTMNVAGAGEVGGPLAQRIDYVNNFFGGGYALHFHGWLRRNLAPSGH